MRRRRGGAPGRRVLRAAAATPAAALMGAAGYLGVLTVVAWRARAEGRARTPLPDAPARRFAVVVPAHNEQELIGATLDSLAVLDYPRARFDVHVVADHCTDDTVAIGRSRGVEVHEHNDPLPPGKGPALQWLLGRLAERGDGYDAFVFIDADTRLSANFLRVADARLAAGASAVQAYYAVADQGTSVTIAFRAAALAARHYLRPLARTRLGASAGLYGNGMVFTREVLDGRVWSDHLTEDIDFQLDLLFDGTRVDFAPDATAEAEMPATLDASRTQHERWEGGRLDLARRHLPLLTRRAITGGPAGRLAYADAAADLALPPFSVLAAATVALDAASVVRALVRPGPASRRGLIVAGTVTAIEAAYVVSALRLVGAPASTYRALLGAPRMVLWKVGLWLRMLRHRGAVSWVRTTRNAPQKPPDDSAAAA